MNSKNWRPSISGYCRRVKRTDWRSWGVFVSTLASWTPRRIRGQIFSIYEISFGALKGQSIRHWKIWIERVVLPARTPITLDEHRLIHYVIYGMFTLDRALKLGEFIYPRNILIDACYAATIASYCPLSLNDYEEYQWRRCRCPLNDSSHWHRNRDISRRKGSLKRQLGGEDQWYGWTEGIKNVSVKARLR